MAASTNTISDDSGASRSASLDRCVIVVDRDLPIGYAANAAAVIALTIGHRHPDLVAQSFLDRSGCTHPGLIPIGIAVLASSREDLREIRQRGLENGCDIVDFPAVGQQTTNYQAFREMVALVETADLEYVGVGLIGRAWRRR